MDKKMQGIHISRMTRSDLQSIFQLQREFDSYIQSLSNKKREVSVACRESQFAKYGFGKNPMFYCLVARKARKAVGYLCYHFGYDPDEMQGPVIHVVDIFVTKDACGLGVGKALMKEAASICKKASGIGFYFCVWRRNRRAIKFYKTLGADWVKEVPLMAWDKKNW